MNTKTRGDATKLNIFQSIRTPLYRKNNTRYDVFIGSHKNLVLGSGRY